ncbi:MAG: bifunctional 4-hydroxy-2-oxoglutarate aldolase/2-dehydro-3-deoxy-phosphogluconate aldolase [Microbacterium sp.]|jgi:2-dehydro-3-deoxyphosphogluconate aldolase/(4S)-4-hydroxy-2-oxoglutarate aldolase|uniref:bifunctional 4-hydroxy-2-oxoglutarate aldolase/2-dehydro-3-deoxy-phosphogluconate aldolase n=1 Tax=Microbacterium sp. TaxID=51671 RepID=UPI00282A9FEE|nr:bifunctional 4-hydroxy-2-oxoglutarate aldolase/2-dehydro-3-deoxy-phosphogluconate aldolase [Microbacterium sp.]MDR2321999.1 bifunctional 4-hydroxy-2-oxoglutarate aldolase/2-dehydro-3-deoxy-phosphogluconate aldolase [Microbacterium sp.]
MTGENGPDAVPRAALPVRTRAGRLIVVVRAGSAEESVPVLDALVESGIVSLELTLTTPGILAKLPELVGRYAGAADVGVGTIVDPEQLRRAAGAGAGYLVTPVSSPALVAAAVEEGVPIVPGGLTPSELYAGWAAGAAAVKVFPAGQMTPGYVKDLRGPFPDIEVVPSGGIDLAGASAWLQAGATAVSVGGPLLGDAFRGGDLAALRRRAAEFVAVCAADAG